MKKGSKMATKKFKLTRSDAPSPGYAEAMGAPAPLAVQRPACPLCGVRAADTKVSLGPVSVEICRPCSEPMWNAMGLISFFRSKMK